ncbi:MAG TPA: DUF5752 family protein, partial [Terriglobales bacterium]
TSIASLRERIVKTVEEYLRQYPRSENRPALEPFYFCSSETVVIPTDRTATDLQQFAEGVEQVSLHSIHYHFIEARLRLRLMSNDFSLWLDKQLGMPALAEQINRIDIYTSTLQEVRSQIVLALRSHLALGR